MPFYIYAWIGALTSGLFVITAKLTSKHSISNPWLFNCLLVLVTLFFTVPASLFNHAGMPVSWWPIILASLFLTLFNIFWIFSTYALDVSTLTPLFNFRGVFAVLLGFLFLNERFSQNQIVYIGIILIAGMFSSMDEKFSLKSFFRKKIFIGILTTLFLAVYNVFVKVSLATDTIWTTNLWIAIINCAFLLPTLPMFYKDMKKVNSGHILPIGMMGIFATVTDFAANIAYGVNVGISSLIMNTPFSMILAFMLSIFAPKLLEKHSLKIYAIRFGATAIMIWSVMQLTK
jgi:drug/metabolite transporter (DMT)-like permease